MPPTKQKKTSSRAKLDLAVQAIKSLIAKWQSEEGEEAGDEEHSKVVQLQSVLETLTTKDNPQVCVSKTCRKL
jgi:hypothetical protein